MGQGKLGANLVSNVAFFALNIVVSLWLVSYLVRQLGVAAYGLVPLAVTVAGYFNVITAGLMGIRPNRIFATATGLAMVVVTIAALYLGTRANFDPTAGPARLIYAFEALIIGGLGSLWGTLAGGIILVLAQTVGAAINPEWQILAGHLAFLVVLLLRPRGLFPRAVD